MKKYNVAILGATGAVGTEFLKLIEERNFPFAELRLLASKRSAGKQIEFMGKTYTVQEATKDSFDKLQKFSTNSTGSAQNSNVILFHKILPLTI